MAAPLAGAAAKGAAARGAAAKGPLSDAELARMPAHVRDAVLEARRRKPPAPAGKPKTKVTATPAKRRRRRRAPEPVRAGARRAYAPVRRQIVSLSTLTFAALGLVVVYLLVDTAARDDGAGTRVVGAFFGAPSRALSWLAAPDRSIPYSPSYRPS
jgi:hypothetical protein